MKFSDNIILLKNKILSKQCKPLGKFDVIDTSFSFYELAEKDKWDNNDFVLVDFLSKRFDINSCFFISYKSSGVKNTNDQITNKNILEIALFVLYKAVFLETEQSASTEILLKRFNVFFKAQSLISVDWLSNDSQYEIEILRHWEELKSKLPLKLLQVEISDCHDVLGGNDEKTPEGLKEIDLTVMFYEGPNSRAYLETIRGLGLKPKKIIELIAGNDIVTKKPVGRWLPSGLRKTYASNIQKNKIHHWPKFIQKNHDDLYKSIVKEVENKFKLSASLIDRANDLNDLTNYCAEIKQLIITGLNDPLLYKYLSDEPSGAILFTGGGIVPKKLLEITGLKFIHIHPGFLPLIRGADCALWSAMVNGHVSASSFYMAPGIDTGDIIKACWLPKFALSYSGEKVDDIMKYRAVYSFLDPWIRAFMLRKVICENNNYSDIKTTEQNEDDGITYHFMSTELKNVALNGFFI